MPGVPDWPSGPTTVRARAARGPNLDDSRGLDPQALKMLVRQRPSSALRDDQVEFEFALDLLLDGLDNALR